LAGIQKFTSITRVFQCRKPMFLTLKTRVHEYLDISVLLFCGGVSNCYAWRKGRNIPPKSLDRVNVWVVLLNIDKRSESGRDVRNFDAIIRFIVVMSNRTSMYVQY
jgi:hypothetical protein